DLDLALVEGRDDEHTRLRRVDRRDLVELHLLSVHLDTDGVEHVRAGLSRAHGRELVLHVRDVLVHSGAGVLQSLLDAHRTRVPTRSPRTAATTEPGRWMLRTISGSEFSRQSVIAVWSITLSSSTITSRKLISS